MRSWCFNMPSIIILPFRLESCWDYLQQFVKADTNNIYNLEVTCWNDFMPVTGDRHLLQLVRFQMENTHQPWFRSVCLRWRPFRCYSSDGLEHKVEMCFRGSAVPLRRRRGYAIREQGDTIITGLRHLSERTVYMLLIQYSRNSIPCDSIIEEPAILIPFCGKKEPFLWHHWLPPQWWGRKCMFDSCQWLGFGQGWVWKLCYLWDEMQFKHQFQSSHEVTGGQHPILRSIWRKAVWWRKGPTLLGAQGTCSHNGKMHALFQPCLQYVQTILWDAQVAGWKGNVPVSEHKSWTQALPSVLLLKRNG